MGLAQFGVECVGIVAEVRIERVSWRTVLGGGALLSAIARHCAPARRAASFSPRQACLASRSLVNRSTAAVKCDLPFAHQIDLLV